MNNDDSYFCERTYNIVCGYFYRSPLIALRVHMIISDKEENSFEEHLLLQESPCYLLGNILIYPEQLADVVKIMISTKSYIQDDTINAQGREREKTSFGSCEYRKVKTIRSHSTQKS